MHLRVVMWLWRAPVNETGHSRCKMIRVEDQRWDSIWTVDPRAWKSDAREEKQCLFVYVCVSVCVFGSGSGMHMCARVYVFGGMSVCVVMCVGVCDGMCVGRCGSAFGGDGGVRVFGSMCVWWCVCVPGSGWGSVYQCVYLIVCVYMIRCVCAWWGVCVCLMKCVYI